MAQHAKCARKVADETTSITSTLAAASTNSSSSNSSTVCNTKDGGMPGVCTTSNNWNKTSYSYLGHILSAHLMFSVYCTSVHIAVKLGWYVRK